MMPKIEPLDEVLVVRESKGKIPRAKIEEWTQSGDMETMGAVYHFILEKAFSSRISPPLSFEEYQSFVRNYYERCMREDRNGRWCDSRYSAGRDLVNWLRSLWAEGKGRRSAFLEWKRWLADLYRSGDARLRTAIVTATLEHLLEDPALAKYFSDWRDDPVLSRAYLEAMEWAKGHPPVEAPKRRRSS